MSNNFLAKYKNRSATNRSDKRIAEVYNEGGVFDVDLISSDDKVVSAHRYVLSLFSKYLAGQLHDVSFDGLVIIPMEKYTHEILQKIVKLMYFREITIPADMKDTFVQALKFLKIDDVIILPENSQEPFKKPTNPPQKRLTGPPPQSKLATIVSKQMSLNPMPPKIIPTQKVANALPNKIINSPANVQMDSVLPGKCNIRAQSTLIQRTSREIEKPVIAKTPSNKSVSINDLMLAHPNSNISEKREEIRTIKVNQLPSPNLSTLKETNAHSMPEKMDAIPDETVKIAEKTDISENMVIASENMKLNNTLQQEVQSIIQSTIPPTVLSTVKQIMDIVKSGPQELANKIQNDDQSDLEKTDTDHTAQIDSQIAQDI